MSTGKKEKKVVSQEELRRLMRQKQRQSSEKRRVQSPFAKYNSLGQLSCSLCGAALKTELLWAAHVLGKQHKERLAELKAGQQGSQQGSQQEGHPPGKRRAPDSQDVNGKKAKTESAAGRSEPSLPGDLFEKASEKRSAGLSLLAGVYDDDDDEGAGSADPPPPPPPPPLSESAGLPSDFFDSSIPSAPSTISHSGSIQKAEAEDRSSERRDSTAEALPEGFFDDPVRDAKVRNVDAPKDQLDKEWEAFQKEMRQVNTKSEAIVEEDEEKDRQQRQFDEIDQQMECYKRVERLSKVVERVVQTRQEQEMETDKGAEDEEDEEDEEELLTLLSRDWRAKGALA